MEESLGSSSRGERGALATGWKNVLVVALGLLIVGGGWWLSREQELVIFVVSMDTTRPDHLTPYGYDHDTTPTLARLAAEGTRFTNARSTTSWTLPAHMSLFTGLPPDLHDVDIDFKVLDTARPTMGEIFQDAGYFTAGFYTAPYVHSRFGFNRGFEFYEQCTKEPMAFDLPQEKMKAQAGLRERISHEEVTSQRVARRAISVFKRRAPRKLFFLHLFDPHYDFRAPEPIAALFSDPRYDGPIRGDQLMGSPDVHAGMPAADLEQLRALYDAELRWTDANLADVLQLIEDEQLGGRALVVVVGDHGEEFFENGQFGHRAGLRDEVLRVPMIFWGPGLVPAGRVIDDEVALYDVLPTLMDYAGLPARDDIYGRSLRPLIDGQPLEPRPTSASLTFLHNSTDVDHYTRHDSLVFQGLKYTRKHEVPWDPELPYDLGRRPTSEQLAKAEIQVYDLGEDPGETRNLWREARGDQRVANIVKAFEAEQARQREWARNLEHEGAPRGDDRYQTAEDYFTTLIALGYAQAVEDTASSAGTTTDAPGTTPGTAPGTAPGKAPDDQAGDG